MKTRSVSILLFVCTLLHETLFIYEYHYKLDRMTTGETLFIAGLICFLLFHLDTETFETEKKGV